MNAGQKDKQANIRFEGFDATGIKDQIVTNSIKEAIKTNDRKESLECPNYCNYADANARNSFINKK